MIYEFKMLENEFWWGGTTFNGLDQPFNVTTEFEKDFNYHCPNQTMPLFVSNMGRVIWSDNPFKVKISGGVFTIEGEDVILETAGNTLKEAYLYASKTHFPFSDKKLPEEFFKTAQYNTWMQYTYDPTEKGVLEYAHAIIDNGFKPGIFIIDEGWHGRYGDWEFDRLKFPHPKEMIDELHSMGFIVMLWVVPNFCSDGLPFLHAIRREFNKDYNDIFFRNNEHKIGLFQWWNGFSASYDMTKECDRNHLDRQLQHLMTAYGVDGFKFDGGNVDSYSPQLLVRGTFPEGRTPAEFNLAWNEFGERYKYHEYKDTYKGGGKAVIQRLCDRNHSWNKNGLTSIIPSTLSNGLIGHPYICPDMVGGGEWTCRTVYRDRFDPELFVRMAQCSALFPMIQFSWAPWEDLDEEYLGYVHDMAMLHSDMSDEILALVDHARLTGEPIIRHLEYCFPHCGFHQVLDQFMLGDDILVAPVVTKGSVTREVKFPEGKWQSQNSDGTVYECGTHTVPADIGTLPWFRKVK